MGIIPKRVNLPGVSYPSESIKNPPKHDSLGYDTPASHFPLGMIPQRVTFFTLKFKYLSEISTKIENILTLISDPDWFERGKKLEGENLVGLSL